MSLNDLLKRSQKPEAILHWSRPGVEYLSRSLYDEDPMGLRGFGVPSDEYEPEAELALAFAFGVDQANDLWSLSPRRPPRLQRETLDAHLRRSFLELFGEEPFLDESVLAFGEALKLISVGSDDLESPGRSSRGGSSREERPSTLQQASARRR
jgi:hypothetical protein